MGQNIGGPNTTNPPLKEHNHLYKEAVTLGSSYLARKKQAGAETVGLQIQVKSDGH